MKRESTSESMDVPVQRAVQDYYGSVLQSSGDLRTTACCSNDTLPEHLRELLSKIHDEVKDRFYGCGSPLPPGLEGATVLDLGCGSGRDVFLLSALVGEHGRVIGVDMTREQLDIAERHRDFHARAFGYAHSNVQLLHGDLANLTAAGIADASVDVVVSNCVLNLVADKQRAFAEILRVIKPGGELYFADVHADRRLPRELLDDPVLVGECLAGAMYTEDFRRLLTNLGVADARSCARNPISFTDREIAAKIGFAHFESITWRLFKLELDDRCEDYGQVATYRGSLPHHPHYFALDDHHCFETDRPLGICGNTADMLTRTRYAPHFEVRGDRSRHFGLFACAPAAHPDGAKVCGPGCC